MKVTLQTVFLFTLSSAAIIQLSSCSFFVTKPEAVSTGIIDADNPDIQYIGRFDFSDPKKVVFDWAGVYICSKFTGTSCSIRLADSTDEYAIIIDEYAPRLLTIDTSKVYKVASGLSDSVPHTIVIQKRTEPLVGAGVFMGFILDKGATLLPLPERPGRRTEFIGNSITSGYGVLGDTTCHFSPQTEDAAMAYAAMTGRELHADYHLISYSGRGVVRNYGDKNKTSINPMPALYDRTCYFDSTMKKWDFKKWVPQAVVINLGTNDFSTQPCPDSAVFVDAYLALIDTVRSLYPGVTVFCVSGPMIGEPCTHYVREVVMEQQRREGRDKDVFFVEIPRSMMTDSDWGCDVHPNVYGADKMADVVVRMIRLRMNW
jgi:hypothetical protein